MDTTMLAILLLVGFVACILASAAIIMLFMGARKYRTTYQEPHPQDIDISTLYFSTPKI